MKVLKFKTNIDSKDAVSTELNKEEAISRWNIDTEQLLSVSGNDLDPQIIKDLVTKAGYKAELVRVIGLGGEDI